MNSGHYIVIEITDWPRDRDEPMGQKAKGWIKNPSDGTRWLFKAGRPNTGEDWAEKAAAETAAVLGLPHARVELATRDGLPVTVSLDFIEDRRAMNLVHGNELLSDLVGPTYPTGKLAVRTSEHTFDRVFAAVENPALRLPPIVVWPSFVHMAVDLFIGYLILDGLIGNTDRHHQNWATIQRLTNPATSELAPTFDHASCLGRNLSDEQ